MRVLSRQRNEARDPRKLHTTRWTVIREAAQRGTPGSRLALRELFATYEGPVHAFVRRKWPNISVEDARDLTQGFFTELFENNTVKDADQARGKFRSWLLKAVQNHCINWWKRQNAGKRKTPLSSDEEPAHDLTPERVYERAWALALLERALRRLRDEYDKRGEGPLFEKLKLCVTGWDDRKHEELARELGIARVNTFNVKVSRFKERFRTLLRDEIARTVSTEDEIEEELCHLLQALRAR